MSGTDGPAAEGGAGRWSRARSAGRIPVLALRAAVPGDGGRDPRAGQSLRELAHREAAAADLVPGLPPLPGEDNADNGLAANTRLMTRLQGGWRVLFVSIWLGYLVETLQDAWNAPDPVWRVVGVTALVLFSATYVGIFVFIRRIRTGLLDHPSLRWVWGLLVALIGLILLTVPAAGHSALAMTVYLAVITMFLIPSRVAAALVILYAATVYVSSTLVPGWPSQHALAVQVLVTGLAIWGIVQLLQRNNQLARAREEITSLAVSQERLRFSRDLHDILGHSLTVITIKAELAGRLVRLDPERAEREIAEVEELARTALADVRSTAAGYRDLTLAGELASARTALDAAGIEAELVGAVTDVPAERLELFAWTVREGVTNVVRHSGARHCRVTVGAQGVEITDDGKGPGMASPAGDGNGLAGLRERAETLGALLSTGRAGSGGFRLRVGW